MKRGEHRRCRCRGRKRLKRFDLINPDWDRCTDLVHTYADLGLGLLDASLVALAERLSITALATLNSRDFHVVCPAHTDASTSIP